MISDNDFQKATPEPWDRALEGEMEQGRRSELDPAGENARGNVSK